MHVWKIYDSILFMVYIAAILSTVMCLCEILLTYADL